MRSGDSGETCREDNSLQEGKEDNGEAKE